MLGEPVGLNQSPNGCGLFQGRDIFPLDVGNKLHEKAGLVIGLFDDTGKRVETGDLGGPIAPLSTNDQETILIFRILDRYRIDDPADLSDGPGKGLKGFLNKCFSGLIRVRLVITM